MADVLLYIYRPPEGIEGLIDLDFNTLSRLEDSDVDVRVMFNGTRKKKNTTYTDNRTIIWIRERTTDIAIMSNVRTLKWFQAGHVNRLKDDRWTSHVTTWRPHDKKTRQGKLAQR